jgi:hypothetical protein
MISGELREAETEMRYEVYKKVAELARPGEMIEKIQSADLRNVTTKDLNLALENIIKELDGR